MTNKAKSSARADSRSAAGGTARFPKAAAALGAGSFGKVASDTVVFDAKGWSFDGVLQRVLGFSRVAEREGDTPRPGPRSSQPSSKLAEGSVDGAQSPGLDALRLFVRSLDPETQGKMRALMRAGRDAQALPAALAALAAERPDSDAPELFARGAQELQDLQRGHAVACATSFDLERELAVWSTIGEPESLDERVWLRFGRELARSRIEEWACFAVVDSRDRLQKLYLRRGDSPWWSFAVQIDRPSERALRGPQASRAGRSRLIGLPVHAALGRSCHKSLRAVRRASLAVTARFGRSRPSGRRAGDVAVAKAAP